MRKVVYIWQTKNAAKQIETHLQWFFHSMKYESKIQERGIKTKKLQTGKCFNFKIFVYLCKHYECKMTLLGWNTN